MKLILRRITIYCFASITLSSCGTSSEVILKSSKNLQKGTMSISSSVSLNPTVIPTKVYKDIQTNTLKPTFESYPHPFNPIISAQFDYGISHFYNLGGGFDLSLIGGAFFVNNKIEFTSAGEEANFKKFRVSYYNKTSITRSDGIISGSYVPSRVAHFEMGNYLIMGLFVSDLEFMIIPHIDLNYLITENSIDSWDSATNTPLKGEVIDNKLSFTNYGLNIALKTKRNLFFEGGVQYINSSRYGRTLEGSSYIQFMLGVGYSYYID